MAKIYRFDNGFIGTFVEFGKQFGKSKELGFRPARAHVGSLRYNRMTLQQQVDYERNARYAVPEYRIVLPNDTFYVVSKRDFDQLDLPESRVALKHHYPLKHPQHTIRTKYSVDTNRYQEKSLEAAMQLYAKDAVKMTVSLLYATGYIHTGNCQRISCTYQLNHTDVRVIVQMTELQDGEELQQRFEFDFGSTCEANGCSFCQLQSVYRYVGEKSDRLFNFWSRYQAGFEGIVRQIGHNRGVYSAENGVF